MKTSTLLLLALATSVLLETAAATDLPARGKWAASWATPIAQAYGKSILPPAFPREKIPPPRPNAISFALPDNKASDQTFRMIVKPDLWGEIVRVRFSNVFGEKEIVLASAAIGLQESGGHLLQGTNVPVTFGGKAGTSIPAGGLMVSDPVHLSFVTKSSKPWLRGRNLAISFAVSGETGSLSFKSWPASSYLSRPKSGDHTLDDDDAAFPYAVYGYFLVNELDVMAEPDTSVVCALGESLNDNGGTANGYDLWPDALSWRLHRSYGDKVSVVNMGIGANTVMTEWPDRPQPAVKRLDRDVLSIAGLTAVVWMQGHNELVWGAGESALIEGYRNVVARLHASGIKVVGATLTTTLWPEVGYERSPLGPELALKHGSPQYDALRKRINDFIRTSGLFDSVVDMSRATEDPETGALYKDFQDGDYIHPNRAGHVAMGAAVDLAVLAPGKTKPTRSDESLAE